RAHQSGIYRSLFPMGGHVAKGDLLGLIDDPYGCNEEHVLAPTSGIVIGRTNLPLVYEGDALCHIARFKHVGDAADSVENFQSEYEVETDVGDEINASSPIV
ncbi:MAG: succinylglutamate desuccinylase/aspartoacylase family protein, partial [Mariprofundaceae bacterium]|nr:succinylglutamate desuccinylase/aspartoacylase family protein [Mariprofundaceae bacterium]